MSQSHGKRNKKKPPAFLSAGDIGSAPYHCLSPTMSTQPRPEKCQERAGRTARHGSSRIPPTGTVLRYARRHRRLRRQVGRECQSYGGPFDMTTKSSLPRPLQLVQSVDRRVPLMNSSWFSLSNRRRSVKCVKLGIHDDQLTIRLILITKVASPTQ